MFKRVKFGGLSGTSFKEISNMTSDVMFENFGEPDMYGGDNDGVYNWEFRSLSNANAVYNIYTRDNGRIMELGYNGLGENLEIFKDWLFG